MSRTLPCSNSNALSGEKAELIWTARGVGPWVSDAAMATAQAQLKLAAACAAALGEDAPKLTKDGRKARGKREKDPNRPAYAETA